MALCISTGDRSSSTPLISAILQNSPELALASLSHLAWFRWPIKTVIQQSKNVKHMSLDDFDCIHIALPKWVWVQKTSGTGLPSRQSRPLATQRLKIILSGDRETWKRYDRALNSRYKVDTFATSSRSFFSIRRRKRTLRDQI